MSNAGSRNGFDGAETTGGTEVEEQRDMNSELWLLVAAVALSATLVTMTYATKNSAVMSEAEESRRLAGLCPQHPSRPGESTVMDIHDFNIPAQSLRASSAMFSEQSDGVLVDGDYRFDEIQTNAVRGRMSALEAVDVMLQGTKLAIDLPTHRCDRALVLMYRGVSDENPIGRTGERRIRPAPSERSSVSDI